MNFKTILAGVMLTLASVSVGGCAVDGGMPRLNPWQQGVAPKNYFYGDQVPTARYFDQQTKVVRIAHCRKFAKETNPSSTKAATAFAVNHGIAGLAGGTAGYAADEAIVLGMADGTIALGAGVYNGVASAFSGAMSGAETRDLKVAGEEDACVVNNTAGFRSVAPSELKELRETGHSKSLEDAVAVDPAPVGTPRPVTPVN